jgi:hypothetical protein
MQDDLNQRLIASAERMVDYHDRLFEVFQRIGNESKSRIVWLVAIAGFAIINIPALTNYREEPWPTSLVPAAWVLTALLGAVTHWQFRNRSVAEIQTYIAKRELLLGYIASGPQAATMAALNDILTNEKEPPPKHFKFQLSVTRFADRLELATMLAFALSMALTIRAYLLP